MIYRTHPARLRQYDRSDFRRSPQWVQRRGVRTRRLVLAVAVPLVCGALTYLALAGGDPVLRVEGTMCMALLPCMVLWPVWILTWKNDYFASRRETVGRWDDKLDLQPKRLVYSYRKRRQGKHGQRYESSVPYSLLDRILYFPDRQFLILWCGGVDTIYDDTGAAIHRTNFWTGFGTIHRCNHRVFLPMAYDDNEAVLRALAELSGTEVERYPGTDGRIPADRLLQNPSVE